MCFGTKYKSPRRAVRRYRADFDGSQNPAGAFGFSGITKGTSMRCLLLSLCVFSRKSFSCSLHTRHILHGLAGQLLADLARKAGQRLARTDLACRGRTRAAMPFFTSCVQRTGGGVVCCSRDVPAGREQWLNLAVEVRSRISRPSVPREKVEFPQRLSAQLCPAAFAISGVWNAPDTASGSARRAPAALQFSIASARAAFTCDNQLTRAVVVYRTDHAGGHLRAGFFNYAVLQTEDSRHAAVDRVRCLLHQLAAHGNDLHAVCEGNNTCSRQCGVFTEREACRCLEFHACFLQCSPGCHGMGENRDLGCSPCGRALPCRSQSTAWLHPDRRLRLLPQKPAWQPASSHR